MTTKQKTETKIDDVDSKIKESMETGVEKVIEAQEIFTQAFDTFTRRNLRVSEKFAGSVTGAQQDLIELYRAMAKDPTAYAKNAETAMNSMTEIQQRTLEFAKLMYKEQADSAAELKEIFAPFIDSGKKMSEGTKSWMGMWTKPFQMYAN